MYYCCALRHLNQTFYFLICQAVDSPRKIPLVDGFWVLGILAVVCVAAFTFVRRRMTSNEQEEPTDV